MLAPEVSNTEQTAILTLGRILPDSPEATRVVLDGSLRRGCAAYWLSV
jgi:hypothetical protein